MNKLLLIILIPFILYGARNRHVKTEWNTNAVCLERNFSNSSGAWHHSPWLGVYYQTTDWWIYHCSKGWGYPESDGNQGLWLYWEQIGSWIWTKDGVYPLAYNLNDGEWFNFCD